MHLDYVMHTSSSGYQAPIPAPLSPLHPQPGFTSLGGVGTQYRVSSGAGILLVHSGPTIASPKGFGIAGLEGIKLHPG